MTFEQYGSRSGSFVPFIADMLHRVRIVWLFWYNKQELEGINNLPPSEIIQFWKTDFTHYVIPI